MMGLDVFIMSNSHETASLNVQIIMRRAARRDPLHLGNNIWNGARVIILPGARIGSGAIFAAGAVVTRRVPAFATVAGVLAPEIKYRNSA
jgi:acetyltransferase-like isoleucine patch superfamily enzyme